MPVRIFFSSASGSLEMKKRQERLFSVLSSKKIPYEAVDVSQNTEDKDLMREMAQNPTALPPQICNGDVYCGDYNAFENAIEMEQMEEFLQI